VQGLTFFGEIRMIIKIAFTTPANGSIPETGYEVFVDSKSLYVGAYIGAEESNGYFMNLSGDQFTILKEDYDNISAIMLATNQVPSPVEIEN